MEEDLSQYGEVLASWQAPAHHHYHRGRLWYLIAALLAVGLLIYSFVTFNFLFAVLIVMFGTTVNAAGIALGFDPIHYGVLMVVTMLIGAITPPVGSMLFIACSIGGISMEQSLKPLLPCILILVIVCLMILFVPGIVTLAAGFA